MPAVFKDSTAPRKQRCKLANLKRGYVRASPDGVERRDVARNMFSGEARCPRGTDSQNVIFYDARIKKYVDSKQRMKPVLSRVVLRRDGFTAVEPDYQSGQGRP